jgi:hypothetical protein
MDLNADRWMRDRMHKPGFKGLKRRREEKNVTSWSFPYGRGRASGSPNVLKNGCFNTPRGDVKRFKEVTAISVPFG